MKRTPLRRKTPLRQLSLEIPLAEGEKPKRKRKEKTPTQKMLDRADDLTRAYCKATTVECAAWNWPTKGRKLTHCSERIEWAHLVGRDEKMTRHCPEGWLGLCWSHHFYFTSHPKEWTAFIDEMYPGRWEYLYSLIQQPKKEPLLETYTRWVEFYTEKLKEIA